MLEKRYSHFKKSKFLLQYEIFHRDTVHLFFVCMKIFLTAVIKDKHAPDDSLKSDSSFLLRNSMMTDTTSSYQQLNLLKFSFLHAIYVGSLHCSVRLVVVMGVTLGTPNFKPEKNLEFFRLKIRRTQR